MRPTRCVITNPIRQFKPLYAMAEWLWYLSKDRSASNIGKLANIWADISDEKGEVESNYGSIIGDQWDRAVSNLIYDMNSRRAVISIYQPDHYNKNPLDVPCTLSVQFLIRDDKLYCIVNMRSNDLIFGWGNDIFTFCMFQQLMLNELREAYPNLQLGTYMHSAGSLHVYEQHFPMLDKLSTSPCPNTDANVVLKPEWTLEKIREAGLVLPSSDLSKSELYSFTLKSFEALCDSNINIKWKPNG